MMAVDHWMAFMGRRGIASPERQTGPEHEYTNLRHTANSEVLSQILKTRPRGVGVSGEHRDHRPFVRARAAAAEANRAPPELAERMSETPWPDGYHYRWLSRYQGGTPEYELARPVEPEPEEPEPYIAPTHYPPPRVIQAPQGRTRAEVLAWWAGDRTGF